MLIRLPRSLRSTLQAHLPPSLPSSNRSSLPSFVPSYLVFLSLSISQVLSLSSSLPFSPRLSLISRLICNRSTLCFLPPFPFGLAFVRTFLRAVWTVTDRATSTRGLTATRGQTCGRRRWRGSTAPSSSASSCCCLPARVVSA